MKFAILSDTHLIADRTASVGTRRAGFADILALRAVHRLNRFIKPDLVVVLGDVVNDGKDPAAADEMRRMKEVFDLLNCPLVCLPGNHDGAPDAFYRVFDRPPDFVDVGGVRFVPFVDPEEPGYNARREEDGGERLAAARSGWDGAMVALQHVPLFPPGELDCPYNYVNAEQVVADMRSHGVRLAISGHYHRGVDLHESGGLGFLVAPALCEAPFSYLVVEMDGDDVRVERQQLAMPEELGLVDTHVHTSLAYCNENLDPALNLELGELFGMSSIRITEHSGHLYYDRAGYGQCGVTGLDGIQEEHVRMEEYFRMLREAGCPERCMGIEIDCCDDGTPLLRPEDFARTQYRIGAVHQLGSLRTPQPSHETVCNDFLATTRRMLQEDIQSLAHPFRVFRRAGMTTPPRLYAPMVAMLREAGVAAEINFHTNDPDPEFVRLCLEGGVALTFGSDAHNLYEIGEFHPHLDLLRRAGFDGVPTDVLLPLV